MTDREAFLAAIRAVPDDDLPRLVYADWLEEQGDADRAEFIRLSCEPSENRAAVDGRVRELLAANFKRWRIPGLRGRQHFERGFVGEVETSAEWLLNTPPETLREHPIRAVRLVVADAHVARLAGLPVWETVESLTLNNNSFGVADRLETLFGEGNFPRLRGLSLRNNQMWPEAVEVLAGLPITPRLTRLDLSGNPISDAGCDVLGTRPAFLGLRELQLRSDRLNEEDCIHSVGMIGLFWRGNDFTQLNSLNLADQWIGGEGLDPLGESRVTPHLTHLDLSYNTIPAGSIRHIGNYRFEALIRLSLAGAGLDRGDIDALLSWPRLPLLERLDLRDCGDVGGLAALPNVLSGPR